ncbi:glycoside hydrolase family 13 protein [Demequina aurantiaca]|uniref:glycoside hydrolase family 13 protein n=1 Tax=Demequina aurantiaca TaxID=676200 RepID=UPI00078491E2|nr:glycoside hydrolase family 13 protein [Demequina aurantiaca]
MSSGENVLSPSTEDPLWWRHAVIYQVYVRSFADGNGDGTGDIAGLRSRLPYLAALGIDAIWITPWYASPLADGGYDVSDYRAIHPDFGTIEEAELLIAEGLELGIRTIIDVVPNHLSDQHAWFKEALAAGPGSPERERFWFVDSEDIPNHWVSPFDGETWTQTTNEDGTPGQWYLHLFTPEQPDVNWNHPDVRKEYEDVLKFWFDRGVGGVRIDSAALLIKDPELSEVVGEPAAGEHPWQDRDELHEVYASWRAIADSYPGARALVGELWLPDVERFVQYMRPNELHTAFNFDFMSRQWSAQQVRESIDMTLNAHEPVGAPSTWVLSNHDVTRPVTRLGREDSTFSFLTKEFNTPTDLELGTRRSRAAALLTAALPGSLYIYQGDELGLPEVENIPRNKIDDPMHFKSGGTKPGRDGCRVPLPWTREGSSYGFGEDGASSAWLPQPHGWANLSVEAQLEDDNSMLALYTRAIKIRHESADLREGGFTWLTSEPGVVAFRRGESLTCITNFADQPVRLPDGARVLLVSDELVDGELPQDATAWLAAK